MCIQNLKQMHLMPIDNCMKQNHEYSIYRVLKKEKHSFTFPKVHKQISHGKKNPHFYIKIKTQRPKSVNSVIPTTFYDVQQQKSPNNTDKSWLSNLIQKLPTSSTWQKPMANYLLKTKLIETQEPKFIIYLIPTSFSLSSSQWNLP
jgi:hypothetical protein